MAARTAGKDGNWSDVTVWDGGSTLPGSGDTADSNGYTVTIDQNVDLSPGGALINSNAGAGGFAVSGAYTITAALTASVRTVLTSSNGSGVTVAVVGNVTGGAANCQALDHTGAGTVNITGDVTGGSANFGIAVRNSSTGTINITGNVTGGSAANTVGAANSLTGTINITGGVTGGSAGVGVNNSSSGTVAITGTVTAAGQSGANNQGNGTLTATRAKAGGVVAAVHGVSSGGTTWVKELEHVVGMNYVGPISGYCKVNPDSTANLVSVIRSDNGAALVMSWDYPAAEDVEDGVFYALGTLEGTLEAGACAYPAEADVRFGTAFGGGTYTGTLDLPVEADVEQGVSYDNTTKTGTFAPPAEVDVEFGVTYGSAGEYTGTHAPAGVNDVRAGTTYGAAGEFTGLLDLPATGDVEAGVTFDQASKTGTFVVPAITDVASGVTYGDAAEFTGTLVGGSGLTAQQVRDAMKLAPSAGAAAASSLDALAASILEDTGTDIPAAFNALADDTAIATAVRTELATELARIDAAISSRLATAGYTAPDNASITGIKAKTDNLPASPAAVGSQMDLVNAPNATAVTALQSGLSTLTVADIIAGISEGSLDLQEILRIILAALAGKASGAGTTTITFRDQADTKNRIAATVDASGNRSAVTLDGS